MRAGGCSVTSLVPSVPQVLEKQEGGADRWRFELRVRYLPADLHQLYDKDRVTFHFYYQQVSLIRVRLRSAVGAAGQRPPQWRVA